MKKLFLGVALITGCVVAQENEPNVFTEKLDSTVHTKPLDSTYRTKTEFTYDSIGYPLSETNYDWYKNSWHGWLKNESIFSETGLLLTLVQSQIDSNKELSPETKYTYTYNDNGDTILSTTESYRSSTWERIGKNEYSYTPIASGRITTITGFYKPDTLVFPDTIILPDSEWLPSHKFEYTNEFGNITSSTTYKASLEGDWILHDKITAQYIDSSNVKSVISANQKDVSIYDTQGNRISETTYRLENGEWKAKEKDVTTFDLSQLASKIAFPQRRNDVANKPIRRDRFEWDTTIADWVHVGISHYYYSPFVGTSTIRTKSTYSPKIKITPIGTALTFSTPLPAGSTLALYDLSGRKIVSGEITGTMFALPQIASGIYIAEILSGKSSVVQKISIR